MTHDSARERSIARLTEARLRRSNPQPTPALEEQVRLRAMLLNFFHPVYEIFTDYHTAGVLVPGRGGHGELFPRGNTIRAETESPRWQQLGVRFFLTPRYKLFVTIATIGTPTVVANLETARWRCRLLDCEDIPPSTVANKLLGSPAALAEWFADTVSQFEILSDQPPAGLSSADNEEDDPLLHNRERVITLRDDNLNEESPDASSDT